MQHLPLLQRFHQFFNGEVDLFEASQAILCLPSNQMPTHMSTISTSKIGQFGGYGCQPKNSGTPKWMVKIRVPNPMNKWMIWGVKTPLFLG